MNGDSAGPVDAGPAKPTVEGTAEVSSVQEPTGGRTTAEEPARTPAEVLGRLGYRPADLLGQGMEGTVYRLAGGLVGKVWNPGRTLADVRRHAAFQTELAAQRLPFATPEPVAVRELDGVVVSVERELPGVPLSEAGLDPAAEHAAILDVVAVLGTTTAGPAARALPVLDEAEPLRAGRDWPAAFADLAERRAAASRGPLLRALPELDRILAAVRDRLLALPAGGPERVVHGDICPPNILVDRGGRVVALLDWGFLTGAGDNAFDAATAAGFFDMYGPAARAHDDALLAAMTDRLGHPRATLLTYRAAYSLSTATIYSPTGDDGHFAWCVGLFDRPEVRELLDLPPR
ncbi:aminoglycoside phosphotransferase family protein [Streptomyces sp. DSM 44915]|uniref:Aminoglycoside phosphotransferase family protein n=1 Tax=Streptomyces chisholmiae TaxID=3075540 RepID=A0ABU2JT75_9ACTN|nr:aminoglycoside phosphotransferase family protein [Streptomyces sp. DSM 44915]MDT0268175.1 aminoglycoside phosphotransferase family protein [Streptomyces sp. DSM 44915]